MINSLKDLTSAYHWNDAEGTGIFAGVLSDIEERLRQRLPGDTEVALTALQKKALNDDLFRDDWASEDRDPQHLIIHGSTSSGKTLLSEIAILDVLQHGGKAIVLVPLKAMVHERTEQFRKDLRKHDGYRVYGSSSDYMENDEIIINGSFAVAIIVYEKYFAMLSQGYRKILENCRLLVVDELSMLSQAQRGPKLEMALEMTKVMNPRTRIMCLTTSDCRTDMVAQWLKTSKEAHQIICSLRPVGLDEYIVKWDGKGKYRHIPSEKECNFTEPNKSTRDLLARTRDIQIEFDLPERAIKEKVVKEKYLSSVIQKIYADNPDAKILVFVGTKADSAYYADFLSQNEAFFPEIDQADSEYKKTLVAISACDKDDDRDKLKGLLRRGIAYHNAGVSTNLREIIEREFQRKHSPLKAIVATETLTIGVNMPFDAMVMMDCRVPKGTGEKERLTVQEYRNYIGRAGRLGQTNNAGTSWLLVKDDRELSYFWDGYYREQSEVSSALSGMDEDGRAPYYLGLLALRSQRTFKGADTFTEEDINALYDRSLSKIFEKDRRKFSAQLLIKSLYDGWLCNKQGKETPGRRSLADLVEYEITDFGKDMAPYALSVDTCVYIYSFFVKGFENHGMPSGISQDMIDSDCYLLEILYHICFHQEVASASVLMLPQATGSKQATKRYIAISLIWKKLKSMLEEEDESGNKRHLLWNGENSELFKIKNGDIDSRQDEKMQAVMRAILIYYWTQGKTVSEIKMETGFDKFLKIINGDLERLAEVISYHLDAIHNSLKENHAGASGMFFRDETVLAAFYALQTRVKYGMSRNLVVIANKHVHGLDRSRILEFGKLAKARGYSPRELLMTISDQKVRKYMTVAQKNMILQQMENRYGSRANFSDFNVLISKIKNDMTADFSSDLAASLQAVFDWDGVNIQDFSQQFFNVLFYKDPVTGHSPFVDFQATRPMPQQGCFIWTIRRDQGNVDIYTAVIPDHLNDRQKADVQAFFNSRQGKDDVRLLIFTENISQRELALFDSFYDIAMSTKYLAITLVQAVVKQRNGTVSLLNFLTDAYGIFTRDTSFDISLMNYIEMEPWNPEPENTKRKNPEPTYYLLCSWGEDSYNSFNATELRNALVNTEDLNNYQVLPWGSRLTDFYHSEGTAHDSLQDEKSQKDYVYDVFKKPVIIFVRRSHIVHSKSLTRFFYILKNNNYHGCKVIFDSDRSKNEWDNGDDSTNQHGQAWISQNSRIPSAVTDSLSDAVETIRRAVNSYTPHDFLIGISYAHFDSRCPVRNNAMTEAVADSDIAQLRNLVDNTLRPRYGEDVILFDQYWPAKEVFIGSESQKKSLEKYRRCKISLILSNWWTLHNKNCVEEIKVIKEQFHKGEETYLYLSTGSPAKQSVKGEYTESISNSNTIIAAIDSAIGSQ